MNETIPINVRFFALLREQAGRREALVAARARTPAALYAELRSSRALTLPVRLLTFAVNERYVPGDAPLTAGDRVAFIPPVAGG